MTFYVGIDNGSTGTIGIVRSDGVATLDKMPTKHCLDFHKIKTWLDRIDHEKLQGLLAERVIAPCRDDERIVHLAIERPFTMRYAVKAMSNARRSLEAVLIVLERLQLPYSYIDSKEWQRVVLPKGLKERGELKEASLSVAQRLFPKVPLTNMPDGDGLLIAEYLRRLNIQKPADAA